MLLLTAGGLIVALTGVWLTLAGRPFGVVLQTVHKLVALAVVVFLAILAYRLTRSSGLASGAVAPTVATALLAVTALASGGVVSATDAGGILTLWIHRVGSWGFLASAAGLVWVLRAVG